MDELVRWISEWNQLPIKLKFSYAKRKGIENPKAVTFSQCGYKTTKPPRESMWWFKKPQTIADDDEMMKTLFLTTSFGEKLILK